MAKLTCDPICLEIQYCEIGDHQWIGYKIAFWSGVQSIINPALQEKNINGPLSTSDTYFLANEYQGETLISTIREVLDSGAPLYWQPIEPDVSIAFYPRVDFPFTELPQPPFKKVVDEDTPITVVAVIDAYNFHPQMDAYMGNGPALVLITNGLALRTFLHELESDFGSFRQKTHFK